MCAVSVVCCMVRVLTLGRYIDCHAPASMPPSPPFFSSHHFAGEAADDLSKQVREMIGSEWKVGEDVIKAIQKLIPGNTKVMVRSSANCGGKPERAPRTSPPRCSLQRLFLVNSTHPAGLLPPPAPLPVVAVSIFRRVSLLARGGISRWARGRAV